MKPNAEIGKKEFYLRTFTWGLPVTLGGAFIAFLLLISGHRPERYGHCLCFTVGKRWGGASLGPFVFVGRGVSARIRAHEHGHSIQNCYYGPLMPFLVNIPSSTRFWYRRAVQKWRPKKRLPPYDSIWFEAEATELGNRFVMNYDSKH